MASNRASIESSPLRTAALHCAPRRRCLVACRGPLATNRTLLPLTPPRVRTPPTHHRCTCPAPTAPRRRPRCAPMIRPRASSSLAPTLSRGEARGLHPPAAQTALVHLQGLHAPAAQTASCATTCVKAALLAVSQAQAPRRRMHPDTPTHPDIHPRHTHPEPQHPDVHEGRRGHRLGDRPRVPRALLHQRAHDEEGRLSTFKFERASDWSCARAPWRYCEEAAPRAPPLRPTQAREGRGQAPAALLSFPPCSHSPCCRAPMCFPIPRCPHSQPRPLAARPPPPIAPLLCVTPLYPYKSVLRPLHARRVQHRARRARRRPRRCE